MTEPLIDIIIPTWNNEQFLDPCVTSIVRTGVLERDARLIVINNGDEPIEERFGHLKNFKVVSKKDPSGLCDDQSYVAKKQIHIRLEPPDLFRPHVRYNNELFL